MTQINKQIPLIDKQMSGEHRQKCVIYVYYITLILAATSSDKANV